jgi:hypothetical protein
MGASGLTVSRRFFISGRQRERTWTEGRECSTLLKSEGGRSSLMALSVSRLMGGCRNLNGSPAIEALSRQLYLAETGAVEAPPTVRAVTMRVVARGQRACLDRRAAGSESHVSREAHRQHVFHDDPSIVFGRMKSHDANALLSGSVNSGRFPYPATSVSP